MNPGMRLAFAAPVSIAIAVVLTFGVPHAWVVAAMLLLANLVGYVEGRTRGGWSS